MKNRVLSTIVGVVCACACAFSVSAFAQTTLVTTGTISGDDPDGTANVFGDAYGGAFDTWEDWIFVGTPRETVFRDGFDMQDGAVYIYKRDAAGGFVFHQKLTRAGNSGLGAGVNPIGDRFGGGIDAANGWLFAAAANDQNFPGLIDPREGLDDPGDPAFFFAGQIHVYKLNSSTDMWEFNTSLTAPTPKTGGSFGTRTQASHMAVNDNGKIALIGELNAFGGSMGELHSFRQKQDTWQYVETISAPATLVPGLDTFADKVVFLGGKYFMAGSRENNAAGTTRQGTAYVYDSIGNSGKFFHTPVQSIVGPVDDLTECRLIGIRNTFANAGMDAGGDVAIIADPCFSGAAGPFTGAVRVYRNVGGAAPLSLETIIEGDAANLYLGSTSFSSRFAVDVASDGAGLLLGTPESPFRGLPPGDDVQYWTYDDVTGLWTHEADLTSDVVADLRSFGQSVWFADDDTALVRHNNFIDPFVTGYKSNLAIFDLTP